MNKLTLLAVALGSALALSACAGVSGTVTTSLATAQKDAQTVIVTYNGLKAAAAAFELVNPAYDVQITKAEALADPIVAELTPLVTDATADAATVEALVEQLQTQMTAVSTAVKGG